MSKNKTETTATKAPAGSSIAAQCKALVLAISGEVKSKNEILTSTLEWLHNVANEIGATAQRGVPVEMKLEQAQNSRNAIYAAATLSPTGIVYANESDEAKIASLTVAIERYKKAIEKASEPTVETETADEATA